MSAASTSATDVDKLHQVLPPLTTLEKINRPEFVRRDALLQLWKCEHCGEILVQAQQTACGCRICKRCVSDIFREKKIVKPCPLPHDPMDDDLACKNDGLDREKIYADVSAQRNLLKESVFCSYRKFGCDQQILWRKLKDHDAICAFKPKQCPSKGCSELTSEQKFAEHQKVCEFVTEGCLYCGKLVQISKMKLHLAECEKAYAKCEECGMIFSSKHYLLIHQSIAVKCLKFHEPIPCYICLAYGDKNAKLFKTAEALIRHSKDSKTQAIHIQLLAARNESLESEYKAQAQKRAVAETVLEMKKIEDSVESATTQADSLVGAMREVHNCAEQIACLGMPAAATGTIDEQRRTCQSSTSPETICADEFYYRPDFVRKEALLELWRCDRCSEILVQAQQTACGLRICKKCVDDIFQDKKFIKPCPLPHHALGRARASRNHGLDREKICPDVPVQKNLLKEVVYCTNKVLGCDQKVLWRRLKDHARSCAFKPKRCPNRGCYQLIPKHEFSKHKKECVIAICRYCHKPIQRSLMELHVSFCGKAEAKCDECKKTFSSKCYLMIHHSTTVGCLKFNKPIPCYICEYPSFRNTRGHFGKLYRTKALLVKHLEDSKDLHMTLLAERLESLESKLETDSQQVAAANTVFKTNGVQERFSSAALQTHSFAPAFRVVKKGITKAVLHQSMLVFPEGAAKQSGMGTANQALLTPAISTTLANRMVVYNEELINLAMKIKKLEHGYITSDMRLRAIETGSFDGKLDWKIYNFLDSIANGKACLSPKFYTRRQRAMQCRVVEHNGYLGIYFEVLKGDFDAVLVWPFYAKVTFTLRCPSDSSQDKVVPLREENQSVKVLRPTRSQTIIVGFVRLVPFTMVPHYMCQENSVYFIATVVEQEKSDAQHVKPVQEENLVDTQIAEDN